jgi:hypothetical protein
MDFFSVKKAFSCKSNSSSCDGSYKNIQEEYAKYANDILINAYTFKDNFTIDENIHFNNMIHQPLQDMCDFLNDENIYKIKKIRKYMYLIIADVFYTNAKIIYELSTENKKNALSINRKLYNIVHYKPFQFFGISI